MRCFDGIDNMHNSATSIKNVREVFFAADNRLHLRSREDDCIARCRGYDQFTADHTTTVSRVANIVSSVLSDEGRMS